MTRLRTAILAASALVALSLAAPSQVRAQTLDTFSVLGAQTVTNTGPTTLSGNLGLYPGSEVTGQASITLGGAYYINDPIALEAQNALIGLINNYSVLSFDQDLTGQDLGVGGAALLTAGVYHFDDSAQLNGTLTLDAEGDPNAVFIFQIGSSLTTASASSVALINGAQGKNVYFVVQSDATIGTSTAFAGQILALNSISLLTNATITCGAAWAHDAAVTLDSNVITTFCAFSAFGGVTGGTTGNGAAVAAALDAFVTAGGTLPTALQDLLVLLAGLTPEQQAAALAQLTGETGTGATSSGMQAMDTFMSQIFDSAFDDDRTPETTPERGPGTVKALGYADEGAGLAPGAAFAALKANPTGRSVWASAYGTHSITAGDISVGSHDRFSTAFGAAAGYDYRVSSDTKFGIAFGAGGSNFSLSDDLGSGHNEIAQVGIYARKNMGDAYLAAALAYAFNGMSTSRYSILVGEGFTASFSGHSLAAQIETGIHFDWFTPYAALRMQAFYTPAYNETSSAGPSSTYALAYEANTNYAVRTEIGARFATSVPLHDKAMLKLQARLAWAHDFSSAPSTVASFQSVPGAPFTVVGAKPNADSFLVTAGADVALRNGFSVGGTFDGEFGDGVQSYGGKGRVRYAW